MWSTRCIRQRYSHGIDVLNSEALREKSVRNFPMGSMYFPQAGSENCTRESSYCFCSMLFFLRTLGTYSRERFAQICHLCAPLVELTTQGLLKFLPQRGNPRFEPVHSNPWLQMPQGSLGNPGMGARGPPRIPRARIGAPGIPRARIRGPISLRAAKSMK